MTTDVLPDGARIPTDTDAEAAVLGALILDGGAVDLVADRLLPCDFYRERNGWIFEAVLSLHQRGRPADIVTLSHELDRQGRIEAIGGLNYLSQLADAVPTALHAEHYADLVADTAFQRRLIQLGGEIARIGYDRQEREPASERIRESVRATLDTRQPVDDRGILRHDAAITNIQGMLEMAAETAKAGRITSGWDSLDAMLKIRPGSVTVVAGPTSHGKTILCERYAERAAILGKRAVYFHYELGNDQMLFRRLARWSNVPYDEWESGRPAKASIVPGLQQQFSEWPGSVHLVACPGWPLSRLTRTIRRLAAEALLDLVIVDYVQMVPRDGLQRRDYNDARALGLICETLKTLAETLPNRPALILASQVNRTVTSFEQLRVEALRESGEIEEKANNIALLWNVHRGERNNSNSTAIRMWIGKATLGATGELMPPLEHRVGHFDFEEPKKVKHVD